MNEDVCLGILFFMTDQRWLVIISNHQQFELLKHIEHENPDINFEVIVDVSRSGYYGNKIPDHSQISIDLKNKYRRLKSEYLEWYRANNCISRYNHVLTFTEGGCIEWIYLSAARHHKIHSTCIQWSITWPKKFYDDNLSYKKWVIKKFKYKAINTLRRAVGIKGHPMEYLGDGLAERVLTIGDFWTQQLISNHEKLSKKFFTYGMHFKAFAKVPPKRVVIILGAESGLGYTHASKFLEEISILIEKLKYFIDKKYIISVRPHPRETRENMAVIQKFCDGFQCEINDSSVELDLSDVKAVFVKRSTLGFQAAYNEIPLFVYGQIDQRGFDYAEHGLGKDFETVEINETDFEKLCNEALDAELSSYVRTNLDNALLRNI